MDGLLTAEDDASGKYHSILTYGRELTEEELEGYELDRIEVTNDGR